MHHISIMSRLDIFYTACQLGTQTVTPTITDFQGLKYCIKYQDSHPNKPTFYTFNYYYGSNFIRFTWNGNQSEDYKTQNCIVYHQDTYHARTLNRRWSVLGIVHHLLDVALLLLKVNIKLSVASESTDG